MTNIKLTNKTKVVLLSIISILILALTLTYAFMAPIIGNKAKTKVDITAGKLDKLTFIEGDPINLLLNQITLGEGEGNVVGSTSSSAKLIANDTTNEAEEEYDVYFDITKNEFFYTTDDEIPEMILTIKDPNNNNITSIEGLTYISGDISGFDITNKSGKFLVKEGHIITTTSSTTGTTETWTATITFINLETDQGDIEGMSMSANLVLQEPELSFGDIILANNTVKSGSPNFNNISPITTYTYAEAKDTFTSYLSGSNKTIGDGYTFNQTTGTYTLTNPVANQTYSQDSLGKYTCNSTIYSNCGTMYKINEVTGTSVTNSIRHVRKGATYDCQR